MGRSEREARAVNSNTQSAMGANDLYRREGYDLMAAAFEVYNEKGHGFLESVYQECLEKELAWRECHFKPSLSCNSSTKENPCSGATSPTF